MLSLRRPLGPPAPYKLHIKSVRGRRDSLEKDSGGMLPPTVSHRAHPATINVQRMGLSCGMVGLSMFVLLWSRWGIPVHTEPYSSSRVPSPPPRRRGHLERWGRRTVSAWVVGYLDRSQSDIRTRGWGREVTARGKKGGGGSTLDCEALAGLRSSSSSLLFQFTERFNPSETMSINPFIVHAPPQQSSLNTNLKTPHDPSELDW